MVAILQWPFVQFGRRRRAWQEKRAMVRIFQEVVPRLFCEPSEEFCSSPAADLFAQRYGAWGSFINVRPPSYWGVLLSCCYAENLRHVCQKNSELNCGLNDWQVAALAMARRLDFNGRDEQHSGVVRFGFGVLAPVALVMAAATSAEPLAVYDELLKNYNALGLNPERR